MSDSELRDRIASVRAEIAKHLDLNLSDEDFMLAMADRILAAHEVLARLAEKKLHVRCYLAERYLGRKCEGT